jgi:hypothetical protein
LIVTVAHRETGRGRICFFFAITNPDRHEPAIGQRGIEEKPREQSLRNFERLEHDQRPSKAINGIAWLNVDIDRIVAAWLETFI